MGIRNMSRKPAQGPGGEALLSDILGARQAVSQPHSVDGILQVSPALLQIMTRGAGVTYRVGR